MAHGGARKGAGRKPGAVTKKTRQVADRLMNEGTSPLDYLLGVMRGTVTFDQSRFEAAKAAAPYCHAKLVAAKVEGDFKFSLAKIIEESMKPPAENDAQPLH